jgi:hypothetical protein
MGGRGEYKKIGDNLQKNCKYTHAKVECKCRKKVSLKVTFLIYLLEASFNPARVVVEVSSNGLSSHSCLSPPLLSMSIIPAVLFYLAWDSVRCSVSSVILLLEKFPQPFSTLMFRGSAPLLLLCLLVPAKSNQVSFFNLQ